MTNLLWWSDGAPAKDQRGAGSVHCCEQQARDEDEVIGEEAVFHRVRGPVIRSMKREREEQDVSDANDRGLGEEEAGQERDRQRHLEKRSNPGQEMWDGKSCSRNLRGRRVHPQEHKLERGGLRKREGEDQPRDQNR